MRSTSRCAFLLSLVFAAAAFNAAAPRHVAAFDYVVNGGFEDGTNGWSASDAVQFESVDEGTVVPDEGSHSARITLRAGTAPIAIRQTSTAGTPAGTYHFSAAVRTVSAQASVDIQVGEIASTNTLRLTADGSTTRWLTLAGDISVTGVKNVMIAVGVSGTAGDVIYVDDIRFEGAPPATMTPTATPTPLPSATPPPDATSTRTPTATKSPTPSKTATTTTPGTAAAAAANAIGPTLRNAGFEDVGEDEQPRDWQQYGGTLSTTDAAYGGAHAARFESNTATTKWLYQVVLVDGGAAYDLGAWIRSDDASVSSAFLRVSWYESEDGSGAALGATDSASRLTSPSPDYRYLTTGAIGAPAAAHSARLRIMLAPASDATAVIYADDVSFGPADPSTMSAPEPATAVAASDEEPAAIRVLGDSRSPTSHESGGTTNTRDAADSRTSPVHLVINEVMYDPDGPGNDASDEWVELYNATGQPVSLAGWSLADAASADPLPAAVIGPHGFAVVAASDSFQQHFPGFTSTLVVLGGRIGNSLGNDGDRLVLRDPSGAVADGISWGSDTSVLAPAIADVPSGHSIERRIPGADTDSAADFVDNVRPSPGAPFEAVGPHANAQLQTAPAATLAGGSGPSFAWVPWSFAGAAGAALLVMLSWRAVPIVTHRLRHHS